MTKAQEKAEAIQDRKREAFVRKVRTLTGHVHVRLPELVEAFAAGKTADETATAIAIREPVGAILHGTKVDAIRHAAEEARKHVSRVRDKLIEHGWDRNAAAPYPYREHGNAADIAKAKANLFRSLTKLDPAKGPQHHANRMNNDPVFVVPDDEAVARFVENAERDAALYYDAFIVKMVAKVGPCLGAAIEGSHVWSYSILTVTKAGDVVERWHTQQIVNYSVYGRVYLQWPSRLMKGKK